MISLILLVRRSDLLVKIKVLQRLILSKVLESFQRSLFIAKAHKQIGYIERMPKSSEYRRIYRKQVKLWEGLVVFLNKSISFVASG